MKIDILLTIIYAITLVVLLSLANTHPLEKQDESLKVGKQIC